MVAIDNYSSASNAPTLENYCDMNMTTTKQDGTIIGSRCDDAAQYTGGLFGVPRE